MLFNQGIKKLPFWNIRCQTESTLCLWSKRLCLIWVENLDGYSFFLLHFHLPLKYLGLLDTYCIWSNIKSGKNGTYNLNGVQHVNSIFLVKSPQRYLITQKKKQYALKIILKIVLESFFQFSSASLIHFRNDIVVLRIFLFWNNLVYCIMEVLSQIL